MDMDEYTLGENAHTRQLAKIFAWTVIGVVAIIAVCSNTFQWAPEDSAQCSTLCKPLAVKKFTKSRSNGDPMMCECATAP